MKKKSRVKKRLIITLFCVIIILGLLGSYFDNNITPVVMDYCETRVESLTFGAINAAISMVINDGVDYDDLIDVHKDENGDIIAIQAKTAKINLLARQISGIAQQNIDKLSKKGISVPLGSFLDSVILAGQGPEITINFVSAGFVDCVFTSEFIEAGINHTLHKIYIKIVSDVSLIIPASSTLISTEQEVLVSESVLVGKVPETYLKATDINDMLDLIP